MSDSPVPISRRHSVIGAVSSVAAHAIQIGVLVWLQQYLLSRVPLEEYTLLPLVQAPLAIIPLITFTFSAGVGRFVVKAYASHEPERVTTLVSSITPYLVAAASLVLLAGTVAAWQIEALVDFDSPDLIDDARLMLFLLVVSAAIRVTLSPLTLGPYARQRFVLIAALELAGQGLRLLFLLTLLLGVSQRVLWVVVATVVSDTVLLVVRIFISRSLAPEIRLERGAFDRSAAQELIRFGSWVSLRRVAEVGLLVVTPFLLRNFGSAQALAIYHLASLPGETLKRFAVRAIQPLNPPLVAMHVRGEPDRIRAVYLNVGRYGLWAATLVCVPVALLRMPVLSLYLDGTPLTAEMVGLVLLLFLTIPPVELASVMFSPVANSVGRERPAAIATAIYQAGGLVLVVVFVLLGWGAIGAVLGQWISVMVLMPLVVWPLGLRIAQTHWRDWFRRTLIPGFAPALAGAVVWAPLGLWVRLESWVTVGAAFFAGAIPFAFVLYRRGLLEGERRDARVALAKLFGRDRSAR